jgi:hypothetical protein
MLLSKQLASFANLADGRKCMAHGVWTRSV